LATRVWEAKIFSWAQPPPSMRPYYPVGAFKIDFTRVLCFCVNFFSAMIGQSNTPCDKKSG
jgi:hypothetical protein